MTARPINDINEWLDALRLGRYRDLFATHAIDLETLPLLTEPDLIGLSIPLGHRKKLLRAIALSMTVSEPAPEPVSRSERTERRQVTILFCDLVGSTALASRLDPEDLRTIINACLDACTKAVARFNGQVARLLGDGLMAYFGYPFALEDAAECAVRAALHAIEAVGALDPLPGISLQIRAGIATGLVVVGDLLGEGAAREEVVVGATPALAARLTAAAPPGSVLVGPTTRRLFGETFELEALGPRRFKGIEAETHVWRILRERPAETRFDAGHGALLAEMVDREDEIALLMSRWHAAARGEGQVVLLSGAAGIGKSRICSRLHEQIIDTRHRALRLQCSPYHANSALYPAIVALERAAGLRAEQAPGEKRDRLAALLRDTNASAQARERTDEDARLLARLLSIPPGDDEPAVEASARDIKQRTLMALADWLIAMSRSQPLLCLIEDVHWIDPTTLDLITLCIDQIRSAAILIVVTFRPDFDKKWTDRDHVTALHLNRLGHDHTAELVQRVTGGKALPPEVLESILARTDGVPLFTEELTRAVLESAVLKERATEFVLERPLPPMAIPETLQGTLLARLDRSAPVKEVAQIAAAIGREFTYRLLTAVESTRGLGLEAALDQLVGSGLLTARGAPPDSSYEFKHALVRDAAYDTLLHSQRLVLHARIGEVLRDHFPAIAESQPELVAHHFAAAGVCDTATVWWVRAAQHAVHRSANTEAMAHLSRARHHLTTLPANHRERHELTVEALHGQVTTEMRGYAAPETLASWQRARTLLHIRSDPAQRFAVLYGLWAAAYVRGESELQLRVATEALAEAETIGDTVGLCVANRYLGTTLMVTGGALERGRYHLERALTLYDPERHRPLMYQFGQDIGASALAHLSTALYHLGLIDQSQSMADRAIRHARTLNHPHTLVYTLSIAAISLARYRGGLDYEEVCAEVLGLCRKHDLRFWEPFAQMYLSWSAIGRGGDIGEPVATFQRALAALRATGCLVFVPLYESMYAQSLAEAGQPRRALAVMDEAFSLAETQGTFVALPEMLRAKAVILRHLERPEEARSCVIEALAIARARGARSFELRAAMDLATRAGVASERDEARAELRATYEGFTEGFDSIELSLARTALGKLEPPDARQRTGGGLFEITQED